MNIQEAKDKLYDELLYTVTLCDGTEEDLLEIIENLFYIYSEEPAFLNKGGMKYTIKEFIEQRKTLEAILNKLGLAYKKSESLKYIEYKLVDKSISIKEYGKDNYTIFIFNSTTQYKLSNLTYDTVIDMVYQIK
ncbi:hypothetical protein BH792_gp135 [Staphylococcus phage Stau2]|uniref:Uncharacterized protein n=1 Tax=Staphylococcus phage Stau2 TaxID=1200862 RepID=A0A0U1ZUM9_9CAUD|nr:hypothetical protein BH792_gp135 [Staphylococcus phage Stau2]AKA61385.1 hypothetical protein Stau2_134 [Staphylococcus phage Stau2]